MPRPVIVDDEKVFNKANLRKSPMSRKEKGREERMKKALKSNHGWIEGLITIQTVRRRAREENKRNRDLNIRDERREKIVKFNELAKESKKADAEEQSYMTKKALESYWNDSYGEWEL
jgi:hypothetical protein